MSGEQDTEQTALIVYYLDIKFETYTQSEKVNKARQRVIVDKTEKVIETWCLSRVKDLKEGESIENLELIKASLRRRFEVKDRYKIKIVSSKVVKEL